MKLLEGLGEGQLIIKPYTMGYLSNVHILRDQETWLHVPYVPYQETVSEKLCKLP